MDTSTIKQIQNRIHFLQRQFEIEAVALRGKYNMAIGELNAILQQSGAEPVPLQRQQSAARNVAPAPQPRRPARQPMPAELKPQPKVAVPPGNAGPSKQPPPVATNAEILRQKVSQSRGDGSG
jgi:hypothetical protein